MLDAALPAAFEPDLFNTEAYAALHASRFAGPLLECTYRADGVIRGHFQAQVTAPGRAASPGRGPHGGFGLALDATAEECDALVSAAEHMLRRAGIEVVEIVQAPFCHAPRQAAQALLLLSRRGWIVARQELNQAIPIDGQPFASAHATYASRKRLAKAARSGICATRLEPRHHKAAYDAIQDNRRKKGRALSMTWEDVAAMVAAFPNHVHVFAAGPPGDVLAAAICIVVNPRVLYVYAWGERAGAEAASPVTILADRIHGFATERGFTLLDLGTSSVDGVVNPGLHAFKRSLGAKDSLKLSLRKVIAE